MAKAKSLQWSKKKIEKIVRRKKKSDKIDIINILVELTM